MIRKNNWLLTGVLMGLLAWSGATLAADKVYVANEGAATVSVIDAMSLMTLASVSVGQMVFPGVTNAAEAKKASAAAARELGRMAQGTGRYM